MEYIVYLLAEELVRRGHQVTVFTSSDSPTTARVEALCEWNMIEAMERGRAWEYEYYETCNIAEALRGRDSFDIIHSHVGCYAIPLGVLSRTPILHTLHNPITPDAIWLLERYTNAAVTAVSWQQIAGVPEQRRGSIRVINNGCDFDSYEFPPSPGNEVICVPWAPSEPYRNMFEGSPSVSQAAYRHLAYESPEPWFVSCYNSATMENFLAELLSRSFDLILIEHSFMARFLPFLRPDVPKVLDMHNVHTFMAWRRAQEKSGSEKDGMVKEFERTSPLSGRFVVYVSSASAVRTRTLKQRVIF